MAPQLALFLSQEGIELLHRSSAGWERVATADPMSPDLNAEMEALLNTANALSPAAPDVSVILPNDQVKYLSVDTSGLGAKERTALIRQTLEESTPYSADDIVFDEQLDDDVTHVAAVARVTLDEADSFARQFGFSPVAYLAQSAKGHAFAIEPNRQTLKTPAETAAAINELKTSTPAEIADTEPTFTSRRRVPTFRTKQSVTPPQMEGFAEQSTPFTGQTEKAAAKPAPSSMSMEPGKARARSEKERMAVFGTRSNTGERRGLGPLGLGIGLASVVALGVIAFASTALGTNVASFFALLNAPKPTAQFTAPLQPQVSGDGPAPGQTGSVELVALDDTFSDEDQAVLDALRTPALGVLSPRADRTENELRAAYAVTGIWPIAPDVPSPPPLSDLNNLYQTSVDRVDANFDAVALPALRSYQGDKPFLALASPAPAGTAFDLDDRGLVIATRQGALNPDGILIFAGPPPLRQPPNMVKTVDPGEDIALRLRLAGFRPQARPSDLVETTERATLGGLTRSELGQLRPRMRPASVPQTASVASASASLVPLDDASAQPLVPNQEELLETAIARAVPVSLRPDARPLNFAAVVEQARPAPAPSAAAQIAAASAAPRLAVPSIPTSTSVAREATVKNAINLRRVNLIGVYGKPTSRRALVRMGNGRYRKVEVGDRIDGGRVSAIGDAELRYQKSGRDIVLKMPRS